MKAGCLKRIGKTLSSSNRTITPRRPLRATAGACALPRINTARLFADLKSEGEEFDCLVAIDGHPRVERWIRNLDMAPGFSLPTSRGKFFPDFLVKLVDGTVVVVEYKGQFLRADAYEIEKRVVGRLWAEKTLGRCRLDFVFKRGDSGEPLAEQLGALFK